ncbi:MAG TPA: peptidase S24 [Elusimicrobia bacterium]|nr:peptidase S24 [Elusimicrobiota bacterium]
MQLYSGTSSQFIEDSVQNRIASLLKIAFLEQFRYPPHDSIVRSWHNSLARMKDVLNRAELLNHGVALEYQLPLTSKRLDCMITGKDSKRSDNAVIVELKQWDHCEPADGKNEVVTWVGESNRSVLHPSVQVGQYAMYMRDGNTAFHDGSDPIRLGACSYLHNYNYEENDPLKAPKFKEVVLESPVFTAADVDSLCGYLVERMGQGEGMPILDRIQNSKYKASKKLLQHVSTIIKAQPVYTLLDEQLVVYDEVFATARISSKSAGKAVILVRGGPGTGKSVIAINLMADLSKEGFNCHYATGSKAFTETLWEIVGRRASQQFKYFHNYAMAQTNEVDVLILDESHRIRATSVGRFTRKDNRSGLPQIEEIVRAAKVSVFFIDDLQGIKPDEVGNSGLIRATAHKMGCTLKEYELEAQFRCSGSDAFVNWIDNTLDIRKTANILWKPNEAFDFRIFDTPDELENAIRAKAADGATARMTAGFCWPWSNPNDDGTLVNDVKVGDFVRPWNARPDAKHLARGIPKAPLWAYEPGGIDQIGCIYTAQGFEFDYAGVIIGKDLIYDPKKASWVGVPQESFDTTVRRNKDRFIDLVKRTYRVLFSRGLKGCYVHFMDEDTKNFFLSRMEATVPAQEAKPAPSAIEILTDVIEAARHVTHLPVYGLAAAAGGFSEEQSPRPLGWVKADIGRRLSKDMFVAKVKGRSMEPLIPDGSYCVFCNERGGSRDGKIVLVEYAGLQDPDTGMRYTVKKYRSEKVFLDDGSWKHKRITLSPLNNEYNDIVLTDIPGHAFRVSAEFISLLTP